MKSRPSSFAGLAAGLLVAVSAVGCEGIPQRYLSLAAGSVDEIASGVLDMRLMVTPSSAPPSGFAVHGPFVLAAGEVQADLRYTQVAGAKEATVRFVAVAGRAFVVSEGAFYELPATSEAAAVQAPSILHGLGFDGWAAAPRLVPTGTSHEIVIESPIREVAALAGIAEVLDVLEFRGFAGLGTLRALEGDAVDRVVRGGTMTVRLSGEDGLLRSLVVRMRVRSGPAPRISERPAALAEAEVVFSVRIARVNQPVRIRLSRAPRPTGGEPAP
jgi:hypothetical protein